MAVINRVRRLINFNRSANGKSGCLFLTICNPSKRFFESIAGKSFKFSDIQIEMATEARKMKKPDPSALAYRDNFSDHMFEVEWNETNGWGIPRIVPLHYFQYHPGSKVFHSAQAVFEGMKAFRSSDGTINLFRPEKNIERLLKSAERATLPLFNGEEFLKCLKKLVQIDREWIPDIVSSSLYIRLTLIGNQNSLCNKSSNSALLYIITCPAGPNFPSGKDKPISLLADPTYVRSWPGGVGDMKMASNYAPSLYLQTLAQEKDLHQVLWLIGSDQKICEAGAMNVFFLFQKGVGQFELATPALDGTILPGVVRQSLLDLARRFDEFNVSERTITLSEVIAANENNALLEMFVCGTACSVCPVSCIKMLHKDIQIPTMNKENPLYERLYKALTDIQYGRVQSAWSAQIP